MYDMPEPGLDSSEFQRTRSTPGNLQATDANKTLPCHCCQHSIRFLNARDAFRLRPEALHIIHNRQFSNRSPPRQRRPTIILDQRRWILTLSALGWLNRSAVISQDSIHTSRPAMSGALSSGS